MSIWQQSPKQLHFQHMADSTSGTCVPSQSMCADYLWLSTQFEVTDIIGLHKVQS